MTWIAAQYLLEERYGTGRFDQFSVAQPKHKIAFDIVGPLF
jgi:hypothetical protein